MTITGGETKVENRFATGDAKSNEILIWNRYDICPKLTLMVHNLVSTETHQFSH